MKQPTKQTARLTDLTLYKYIPYPAAITYLVKKLPFALQTEALETQVLI
jgi:hypothetical protein